ncbi:ABC transporter ATP-binding protein [Clostridium estertheticum]|uniref:ATP-binding cassette domain-containing protein n=1 Tax=Clostridium estertheticum TaxID=238834 RepID=A0A5N7IYC3_9CLOT|nr:ATP-binding cassette domain-containing protein [Clostridium estertheticum]MBX4261480.1 ABC transporter ATP-binding protein [Clostridium estertheticum]MPQ30819.1 ATP-binding cassette domain-containing protein [Clostridium estertheticum]MPQ61495.1 ATP-binding cassette domain-containing protein [Clostridium estertheticum]NNU76861.1 ATP-binding cassette domain-containing protein [Clostridium estertheticum]WBL48732.1 ABC transporter ATP-binding protein [Clostridium estertheticum]
MIEMENVTKCYGNQVALDGLNLTVKKGEILGFLGPNGAGKSTAMNILTGYISATNGNVRIDGIDILENPEAVKKKIGYLPEIPPLYLDMTVEEYLKFVFRIKKVKSDSIEQSMIKIMSLVKILDVRGRLIKNLSKGYKQRIGLAQALVGDPEVLVLDEPTVGLDPKQIIEIRNLIQKIGNTCTIILSSHILSEVSAICHRVIIINKGKIVASGTPEELSKGVNNSNKVLLRVKGVKEDVYKHIKAVEDVKSVEEQGVHENGTVDILVEAKNNLDIRETLFVTLSQAGFIILMMKSKEINLEEIFLDVTTNKKVGGM